MIACQLRGVHAALPGREKCVLALKVGEVALPALREARPARAGRNRPTGERIAVVGAAR